MASWGMAAYTGRKMWEDARKTQEENERLLAGRELFDRQIEEAEKDAEVTAQAKKESRRIQSLINSKKVELQAGGQRGAKAMAEVLSGIYGGDGSTWQAKDGVIYEIDSNGNTVNATDLRNTSGAAILSMAQQYVPDAATVAATFIDAEKENQKTIREAQLKVLELENAVRVAMTNGASNAQVAQLKGQYDIAVQQLRNQSALDVKSLDVSSALKVANVGLQKEFASQWDNLPQIRKYAIEQTVADAIAGGVPQYDSTGNFTGIGIINPSTNDVTPIELTPEMRSGILSQVDQQILEGGQLAANTGYTAPVAVYLGSAKSGITQRRDAEVAAVNEAILQGVDAFKALNSNPGAGLSQVQIPSYGLPAITSIQPLPVVSGIINPSTNLPVMSQVTQGVRQGIAQQNADAIQPYPLTFGLAGFH